MTTKPIKHLRTKESTEPGHVTRYHAACGATGTAGRDFPKALEFVSCPLCAAKVPRARLHGKMRAK